MENKEFDDWFKSEMPNTYKGVGKEQLESFVYDTAMTAWQARVPEGYVVVPKEPTAKMIEVGSNALGNGKMGFATYMDVNNSYKAMIESEK